MLKLLCQNILINLKNNIMLKFKEILFKRSLFKDVLSSFLMIPGFSIGFFAGDMCMENQKFDTLTDLIFVFIAIMWTIWCFAYTIKKK